MNSQKEQSVNAVAFSGAGTEITEEETQTWVETSRVEKTGALSVVSEQACAEQPSDQIVEFVENFDMAKPDVANAVRSAVAVAVRAGFRADENRFNRCMLQHDVEMELTTILSEFVKLDMAGEIESQQANDLAQQFYRVVFGNMVNYNPQNSFILSSEAKPELSVPMVFPTKNNGDLYFSNSIYASRVMDGTNHIISHILGELFYIEQTFRL